MSKVVAFPAKTRGARDKSRMVAELRRLADMIESGEPEPEIEFVVVIMKQGDEFVMGGGGMVFPKEAKSMQKALNDWMDRLFTRKKGGKC